jgi:branched-chain amino acid transport system permease protein
MTAMTDNTLSASPHAMRDEMIVFAVMALALAAVPWTGIYPFFVMQALCFALLACSVMAACSRSGMRCFWGPPATARAMR